jgi:hypothetical protein
MVVMVMMGGRNETNSNLCRETQLYEGTVLSDDNILCASRSAMSGLVCDPD